MSYILGQEIRIAPAFNKIALDEKLNVSSDFRREFNEWLRDFFGVIELLPDNQIVGNGDLITMNRATYNRLLKELSK